MTGPVLLAALALATAFVQAQEISGDWHGSVEVVDDAPLRLALHIADPNSATLDSADEGVSALPIDSISLKGQTMQLEIKSISGVYEGTVSSDGLRIKGAWRQDGGVWPLNWEKGEDPGNTTKRISDTEAMEKGRAYTQMFYEGKLAELWRNLSPVVHQAFVNESHLGEFRQQTIRRLGSEIRLLKESVNVGCAT